MLVLSRKQGESLVIQGRIAVKVLSIRGRTVRLGIEAPSEIPILRKELLHDFSGLSDLPARESEPETTCQQSLTKTGGSGE